MSTLLLCLSLSVPRSFELQKLRMGYRIRQFFLAEVRTLSHIVDSPFGSDVKKTPVVLGLLAHEGRIRGAASFLEGQNNSARTCVGTDSCAHGGNEDLGVFVNLLEQFFQHLCSFFVCHMGNADHRNRSAFGFFFEERQKLLVGEFYLILSRAPLYPDLPGTILRLSIVARAPFRGESCHLSLRFLQYLRGHIPKASPHRL